jgi:hypothetical protein
MRKGSEGDDTRQPYYYASGEKFLAAAFPIKNEIKENKNGGSRSGKESSPTS